MVEERWFYRNQEEWIAFAERIKLMPCLHCKVVGMLIRHGGLQGIDESSGQIVLRARRVFCSNRNARTGCGRTVSVWLVDRIRRLKVTTRRLWKVLDMAVVGPLEAAIRTLDSRLSDRTWQRIWSRFLLAQSTIRTALAGRCSPPGLSDPSLRPAAEVLAHLRVAFPNTDCPITTFQQTLRTFFV